MALGKLTQDKIIKEAIKKEFDNKFSFAPPVLYYEDDDNVCFLNVETSNLGITTVTSPKITFKQVEGIVVPIFDKYGIPYSKWSLGLQNPNKWTEDLSYLNTDSEDELKQALSKIILYIKEFCIPFWEKYKNFQEVLNLINSYSEEELNQGIFQGVTGIMIRLTLSFIEDSKYYMDKKVFYKKILNEYSQKNPNQYSKMYLAFNELLEFLESPKNKFV